jgi:predicted oxidoreductase
MKEKLHNAGPGISRLIAGAWRWNVEQKYLESLIYTSLENQISSFDHADIYGGYENETLFGHVLKSNPSLRDRMEIITKCGIKLLSVKRPEHHIKHYDTSKQHIIWSAENSLKQLHTNRIDLLLLHRPDPLMHAAEVAEAFNTLKQQGKVLHFGVSNFTPSQFDMLQAYLDFPLVTNQIELSLFRHDALFNGTVDNLIKQGVAPMAWSPLGGGKFFAHEGNSFEAQAAKLCDKYNCSASQLLLAWLLRYPAKIFPIIGTTKPERIQEAAHALKIQLDRQDWFEMLKWVRVADVD